MAATEALSAQVVRKNPLWLRPLPRLAGTLKCDDAILSTCHR